MLKYSKAWVAVAIVALKKLSTEKPQPTRKHLRTAHASQRLQKVRRHVAIPVRSLNTPYRRPN